MVHQGHLTKFVLLQSLQSKKGEDVSFHLMNIFWTFRAHSIILSDNAREFVNSVINELTLFWSDLLIDGRPYHSQVGTLSKDTWLPSTALGAMVKTYHG